MKQLTCRTCKQLFYLTWTDYKRLDEILYCHAYSLLENASYGIHPSNITDTTALSPSLWTIEQVMAALHLGRTKIYSLISREGLPTIRFGRAVRVSPEALRKWLEQRE